MDIQILIDKLKKSNELSTLVQKYTLIVNEKSQTQGALFFIPVESREYKVLIPAPFHATVLEGDNNPTHQKIITHKEAFILK